MKKLILLFVLISNLAFTQFKVTDNSNDWKLVGKNTAAVELSMKTDSTKAKIKYIDTGAILQTNVFSPSVQYQFEFSTEPDTLDKIYNLISQKLKDKAIEVVTLEFPEGKMYLNFDYSTFGGYYFTFQFDNNSSILDKNSTEARRNTYAFNIERLNKFFGKNKKKK